MTETAAKPNAPRKVQVRYYRFRNALKEKASGGKAGAGSGKGTIAVAALQAAEAEFEKMAEDYPDWVGGNLPNLYQIHGRCVDTPEQRHQLFRKLHEAAHDLKGQGGTFGYDLISVFAESLYNFTYAAEEYSDNQVELVKAHIDAMKAVISGRIKGDGGDIGKELSQSLHKAIERYT
jgi:chemotaxis protein histidine kinase CheA